MTQAAAQAPAQVRARPRARLLWAAVPVVLALLAVAASVGWQRLPEFLAARLVAVLRQQGFAGARIGAVEVGLDRLVVHDLVLDQEQRFRIDAVEVEYSPGQLAQLRAERVVVRGAVWRTTVHDDQLALAPFDQWSPPPSAPAEPPSDPLAWLTALPMGELQVTAARVELRTARATERIELGLTADARGDALQLELDARWRGRRGGVRASARRRDAAMQAQWSLSLREDSAAAELAPVARPALWVELAGHARAEPTPAGWRLALDAASAAPVTLAGLPGLPLLVDAVDVRLSARGGWPLRLDGGEPVIGSLSLDTGGDGGVRLPTSLTARGRVDAWLDTGAAEPLRVELRAGALARAASGDSAGLLLRGVHADIACESLQPPRTRPRQRITWTDLEAGDLRALDGELELQVLAPDRLAVTRAAVGLRPHGAVELTPFVLARDTPRIETTVRLLSVSLDDWLGLLSQGKVEGEGILSGSVEVGVTWAPGLAVRLGKGDFAALGGGRVRLVDRAAAREVLAEQLAQVAVQQAPDLQDRLVRALSDFDFERLSFAVVPEGEQRVLVVSTAGRGRKEPQAVDLTVNFRGVDKLVDLLVDARLGWDRAGQLRRR